MSKQKKRQSKSVIRLQEKQKQRQAVIDKERINNFIEVFGNIPFDYDGYKFGWYSADGNYHIMSAHTLDNTSIQNGNLANALYN